MAATACDQCVVYLFRLSPIHWTCAHTTHTGAENLLRPLPSAPRAKSRTWTCPRFVR